MCHVTTVPAEPPTQDPSSRPKGGPKAVDDDLRQLIRQAFDVARESGRADWQQMTTAVLKNRLLDLTDRSFDEADYGARTISDLVRRLSDILLIDDSVRPARVQLSSAETPLPAIGLPVNSRVRPDLWRAVIDYRSGKKYVWDGSFAVASDKSTTGDRNYPELPTITAETMDGWRSEFSQGVESAISDDVDRDALDTWRIGGLPARGLPSALRGRWSAALKDHVVSILENWFSRESLPVPSDLLLSGRREKRPRTVEPSTEKIREFVLRCVSAMTDEELRELRLPPAAVMRAQR